MGKAYDELKTYMDRAMAIKTVMTLFEWDNETLAPGEAEELTSRIIGVLSGEYSQAVTCEETKKLLKKCRDDKGLTMAEATSVRELLEEGERICPIPRGEYQGFAYLTAGATGVWTRVRKDRDFGVFAPTPERIIGSQRKFTGCRTRDGKKLCDVILGDCKEGFSTGNLDRFFGVLKKELVPFLKKVMEGGKKVGDSFLKGDYPEKRQGELGRFLAEYVGFDFDRGAMAVSAHPFTTSLHNKDVHITTYYTDCVDNSLSSVIHGAGHAIYEPSIGDDLTLTPVNQGAGMGMHESRPRLFENITGRSRSFWAPIYARVQEMSPEQLGRVDLDQFVETVNKVTTGLIRTEADELGYSPHVLVRYEIKKILVEEDLDVKKLPQLWADKYEKYLGVRPENPTEGVLQDIHRSQGSLRYFPSYALNSVFGVQLCYHMREIMDFDGLLREGKVDVIRNCLREHIHQYGKLEDSRQTLKDMTREDFNPEYYVRYLKERYSTVYGL